MDRILENTGLFVGLSQLDREQGEAAFKPYEVGPGEEIMVEGEADRTMCILIEGELVASVNGIELGRIRPGETVGEMAMFGSLDRRSATVTTLTHCNLLIIEEDGMKFLRRNENPLVQRLEVYAMRVVAQRLRATDMAISSAAKGEQVQERAARGFFGRIANVLGVAPDMPKGPLPSAAEVLKQLPGINLKDESVVHNIAARCEVVGVAQEEVVFSEGDPGDDAYIVAEGEVGVFRTTEGGKVEKVAALGPGHLVGQVALADARGRSATVRATTPTRLLRIPGAVYRDLETALTMEGRAFRRAIIDAFAAQLRMANEHFVRLMARWE